jgi:hypothetical protein
MAAVIAGGSVDAVDIAPGFKAGINGLSVEGRPDYDMWAYTIRTLRVVEKGAQFAIGDAAEYGEARYGERASQVLDASEGWSEKTLAIYRWVARSVSAGVRRMDRLTFTHHQEVAALPPLKQKYWLDLAADSEEEPWTVVRLRAAIRDNGDLPVTAWFVLVACTSAAHQSRVIRKLEGEGLTCKATVSRRRREES